MSALRTLVVCALIVCLSPLMAVARPLLQGGLSCAGQSCCRTKKHSCCQKKAPNSIASACGKGCCGAASTPLAPQSAVALADLALDAERLLQEDVARVLSGARLAPLGDLSLFQRPPPSLAV